MDSRVIRGLKHDTLLGWVHLINTQRSLVTVTLTSDPVSHEESLIRFASQHSVHALRTSWWLRLSTSEISPSLLHLSQIVHKRIVGHCMLIHVLSFKVNHVSKFSLSCWFSSLLVAVFRSGVILIILFTFSLYRIQIIVEVILSLQRSSFRFWHLIHFKAGAHGWVHYDFAWSLNLLETIQGYGIQIRCRVQVPLFITHNLLKKDVPSSFTLLLFE
jgi:hypothetical protein